MEQFTARNGEVTRQERRREPVSLRDHGPDSGFRPRGATGEAVQWKIEGGALMPR